MIGGMSLAAQQAAPVKKSCNITQCQARKSAATTTSTTTAITVAQTNAAPERASAPATPSCAKKTSMLPLDLQLASLIEKGAEEEDCDPKNCIPANCIPSACDPATKMTTTLAAKQE